MEFIRFGNTGMRVSRLCLGTMTYGEPTERWQWALNEEQSRPFIKKALELGFNFFDTADVYTNGASEEVVGVPCATLLSAMSMYWPPKFSTRWVPGRMIKDYRASIS